MSQPLLDAPDSDQHRPADGLEIYDRAVRPNASDGFLERNNLGLGNLREREVWQQIDRYKVGMHGEAAFRDLILELAVYETKYKLAAEAWQNLSEAEKEERDRGLFIEEHREREWQALEPPASAEVTETDRQEVAAQRRWAAIREHTGITGPWTPPHYRMMMAHNEISRSRGARLLDNLFGRVKEFLGDQEDSGGGFFGGGD